ncbi:hypothetical protein [Croceitalea dokdonensis]|uniref:hypothetical protein n=1 Tax=Croceitalea dokdonensis TaxID=346188 RepID=UPI0021CDC483|nr:hypothetical protein [Croceitalea dokdonensis]
MKKQAAKKKLSLFIEFYDGYTIDKDGVKKHRRKFEYLKLYVHENPTTSDEKRKDKETWELAENILSIRKAEYIQGKYKMKDNKKGNILLFDCYKTL